MKHRHPKMDKVSVSDIGTRTTQLPDCTVGVHAKKKKVFFFFYITTWDGHEKDTFVTQEKNGGEKNKNKKRGKKRQIYVVS